MQQFGRIDYVLSSFSLGLFCTDYLVFLSVWQQMQPDSTMNCLLGLFHNKNLTTHNLNWIELSGAAIDDGENDV